MPTRKTQVAQASATRPPFDPKPIGRLIISDEILNQDVGSDNGFLGLMQDRLPLEFSGAYIRAHRGTIISDSVRSLVQNSCSDRPLHPSQSVAQPPGQAPVVAASRKELEELEILYGVLSAPTPRQGALEHKLPGQMPRMCLHSCPSCVWRLQKRLSVSMDERRLRKFA